MSNSTGVVVCGAVALFLCGFAVREAVMVRRLKRAGVRSQGLVVTNTRDDWSDGHNLVPVIAFVDQQGGRVEFSPHVRGTGMNLERGLEVQVVYEDGKPHRARVNTRKYMMGSAMSTLLGGVAFAGVGVLFALTN
ncbi:DUF3592 domain-containing protein [Streptomyces sp. ISID311]|uniref:DUF3592 domain-containing protein n=1 Tax=Streptomyces sp. ISID311 TaxID=2601673 RepID=UPI00164AB681|nr:DUF3592 domain-containing protein [Streptomyces sp. ISID311]